MINLAVNKREFNTILAALRFWQAAPFRDVSPEWEIAADGDSEPLTETEIDEFAERLNTEMTVQNVHSKFYGLVSCLQRICEEAPKEGMLALDDLPERHYPDTHDGLEAYSYDEGLNHAAEHARTALRSAGIEPAEGRTEWYHELNDETEDA